jgi:hypothetical protein
MEFIASFSFLHCQLLPLLTSYPLRLLQPPFIPRATPSDGPPFVFPPARPPLYTRRPVVPLSLSFPRYSATPSLTR